MLNWKWPILVASVATAMFAVPGGATPVFGERNKFDPMFEPTFELPKAETPGQLQQRHTVCMSFTKQLNVRCDPWKDRHCLDRVQAEIPAACKPPD